ncbi:Methyltransferase domain-containing protein [Rhizobium sp. RU35A]|uniref:class I SAM-dependent methyltransferase n=1 Tax=Rhizobium sp. RU35A TaxID=1907414 RepID=UPI000955F326|nr:class I SAM-dependent methyltransferase [Rhizobium sp. RU35A]SIQ17922.1 Methyltransferase domain-containing protein [Rhizobium sp. RU35A]
MNGESRKFIFDALQAVEGYIDPPDALVFSTLLHKQQQDGAIGGLAEIGIYYGRSYFLLRHLAGPESKVLAIDLFDLEGDEDGAPGQYRRFLENGARLGLPVDHQLVIRGDSTTLRPCDITSRVGPVRFFSIDGGHHLHHVAADSALAMACLADHGVIVFDDTFNPAWPEVTVGVADFLRTHQDRFAAFCMTKYKTYVCRRTFHATYAETIRQAPDLSAFERTDTTFLGSPVVRLHDPIRRRMLYELMRRSGMRGLSERAYR